MSPIGESGVRIKQVINDINYALLYNLPTSPGLQKRNQCWAKNTPLLHSYMVEMVLLMSFIERQRAGHEVKISACLLSSKIDMQFYPQHTRLGRGVKIDLFMSFCPRVVFPLSVHKGDVNFGEWRLINHKEHIYAYIIVRKAKMYA